jgi:hypothetical protein
LCQIVERRFNEFVTRELLAYELVERLVSVEGSNDIVTKPPGIGPFFVDVCIAFAVGIAGDVQPMLCPPFSITV